MPGEATDLTRAAVAVGDNADATSLRVDRMICVGLVLLTLVVFKQTLGFGFVNFDDDVFVYANPDVAGGLTLHNMVTAFTQGSHANWDPLTTISHLVDCQLYGLRAGGHHLTNILLHAISVVLLFVVLRRMTGARWASAFAAALFAIHPLRVESVAWVTERKDVLSGLFFVLTLGAYGWYVEKSKVQSPRSKVAYAVVLLCFVFGLMSKAMLVTVPFVLLLLDYWPLGRFGDARGDTVRMRWLIVEKIPLLALSAASVVAATMAQGQVHAMQSFEQFPAGLRIANALDSVVMYLAQLFFPTGLAVYYPYPEHGLPPWRTGLALLVIGGISVAAWRWRKERPYLLVGWLWNLVMLAPVIGLIQLGQQARADRYTYLPQIGLAVAVAWLAANWWPRWHGRRVLMAAAGTAIITVLSLCTLEQATYWRDSVALWEHCLTATGGSGLAYYNYGLALVERGRPAEAAAQFEKAVELRPRDPAAQGDLGSALFQSGRLPEAVTQLKQAIALDPSNASYYVNLGNALFQEKQPDEAIAQYREAVKVAPDYASAENTLGFVLLQTGRTDEALTHLQKAVQLDPENANGRYTLATALVQKGRTDDAIKQLETALDIQPEFAPAQTNLNDIAWRLATSPDAAARNGAEALDLAQGVVQLSRGGKPIFLRTLAAALAETGRFADATAAAGQALSLAERAGDQALATQLQDQLARYRANQPFRDTNRTQSEMRK